jgi:hypothetical protein
MKCLTSGVMAVCAHFLAQPGTFAGQQVSKREAEEKRSASSAGVGPQCACTDRARFGQSGVDAGKSGSSLVSDSASKDAQVCC